MARTWKLRKGTVVVVEDATASLVVVARDLGATDDTIAVLEEVLSKLKA